MTNITKFTWRGKELQGKMLQQGMQGLLDAGELILDASNQKAPIDEGVMIGTGDVTADESTKSVVISYDSPYAIKQHEDTTLKHKNGREAKFLQSAVQENTQRVTDILASALKAGLT